MKQGIFLLMLIVLFSCSSIKKEASNDAKSLNVSKNGRYLEDKNGKPFLYLACTAWELFHKLNREEATEYLENRKEKGFTVIQAVVLAELDGLGKPNAYGDSALINFDPIKPNEKYFEHVDFIVNKAEELGLFIGMLPTWGDKVTPENGGEPVVFNEKNAEIYGKYLGKRYKDKPIIWILGGDRNIANDTIFYIWKSMAMGLREGDNGNHLITMHPRGGESSSKWFHNEVWFDFNAYQSGHTSRYNKVYQFAEHDYLLNPAKPCIDAEPAYEDIAVKFWDFQAWTPTSRVPTDVLDSNNLIQKPSHFALGFFTAHDIRVHAYWNLLSGACGYTYGNNAIWQMFRKGGDVVIPCLYDWRESMNRLGSDDIRHIRKLFEARDFSKLIPDQSIVYGNNPKDSTHIRAAVANDGSFLIAYLSIGQPAKICMSKIKGSKIKAWWFDPREGTTRPAGEHSNTGFVTFTTPTSGTDIDWVLVLDDATKFTQL
jgi:hypothetical protein